MKINGGGVHCGRIEAALLAGFALPLGALLAALAWRSTLGLSINYNEGWNAYLATAAARGALLYFPPGDLRADTYPPVSFYAVAAAMRLVPDAVFAGRIIAWAAFIAVAAEICAILRTLGGDRGAAWFGVLLFAGIMASQFPDYVGMDDPQMLAHAVMCAGLLVLARGKTPLRAAAAAALMTAGLFIKHTLVAMPAAVALWLLIYDRRAAAAFIATGLACVVAGLAACLASFGTDFIAGLGAPRRVSLAIAHAKLRGWLMPLGVPLAFAALSGMGTRRDPYAALFVLYAGAALTVGAIAAAGDGVNVNAMFELAIAVSLAAGHLLGRLGRAGVLGPGSVRLLVIAAAGLSLGLSAALSASGDVLRILPWLRAERNDEAAEAEAVRLIAAQPGPAVCQTLALCYWAGKAFSVDTFSFAQAVLLGRRDESALAGPIERGEFGSVQALTAAGRPFPTPVTLAALRQHYRTVPVAPFIGELFVP